MFDNNFIKRIEEKFNLKKNNFDYRDLEIIVRHCFSHNKTDILKDLSEDSYYFKVLKFAIRRRLLKEPISQIIGFREFWNSEFYIDQNVLDPRPETELLVEKVLEFNEKNLSVLDLGTGSGCLAISIALERPEFEVFASDKSIDALRIAKFNSKKNKASVTFIKSDWFSKINRTFDIIISNPPYISLEDYLDLPLGIRRFEPKIALCSGHSGLDSFEKIIKNLFLYLKPNGTCLMEIGNNQKGNISKILKNHGFKRIEFFKDLSGKDRVVCVKKDAI